MGHKPDENWEKLWEARAIASCESFLDNRRRLSGKKNNQIESEGNHRYWLSSVFHSSFFGSAIKVWFKVVELSVRQFFAICRVTQVLWTLRQFDGLALCHHRAKLIRLDLIFASAHHDDRRNRVVHTENCVEKWFSLLDYEEFHKLIPKTLTIALLCAWEPNVLDLGSSDSLESIFILTNVVGTHPVHRSLSGCLFVNLFGGLFRQDARKMPHWKGDKKRYFEIEYD